MTLSLIVRPVNNNDFEQWLPLWESYNHFYQRSLASEITEITWSRFFDENEPVYALVADVKGQLLGLTHYLFHRSTSRIALNCYLQDLFTQESARGLGIGRTLITAVCEQAKKMGSPQIYWQTQETNTVARKLYDKIAKASGFIVYQKNSCEISS